MAITLTARAPLGSAADVSEIMQSLDHQPHPEKVYLDNYENLYLANLIKRFLTSGLFGLAGSGFLILGAVRLSEKTNTEPDDADNKITHP